MPTPPSLLSQNLSDFKRDGFLVIPRMYSPQEIEEVSGWIDEIAARPPRAGHEMAYFEDSLVQKGKKILSRIEKFVDSHQGFEQFVHSPKMLGVVEELLGAKAVLFKEKINFKLPGGGGFEPHQDIQPGWDDYCPYFISVLVTIDKSTIENGCLELSAGHHTRGLLGEKWKPLTLDQLKGVEFLHYPMEPGDVAFFDCFVPHQSKPNLTGKPRRNLYLTYNRAGDGDFREKYFADKRKSYPPDFEREAGKEYKFRV
jgi:ectoine hydroxylase-related dioxygenase (phytanoyl-CoA dioxygenase family)